MEILKMIENLGPVSLENEEAVYEAEAAYFYLAKSKRREVVNSAALFRATDTLRKLYSGEKQGLRLDRSNLCIGAYSFARYCWTDDHVKALADCGIDYMCSVPYDTELLDLFAKHGVVADVGYLPGWWGGNIANNGKMAVQRPLALYEEKAKEFKDHPAIWALAISDEASCWDMPHHEKVVDLVQKSFPNQLPYINLQNPGPGFEDMGASTFDEYIECYVKHVPLDYISYDHYMYEWGIDRAYMGYEAVSKACRKHNRDLWVVLQVNKNKYNHVSTNLLMLRYQAYSALAYGARAISWACWTAGWWEENVVDTEGNITGQYDILKTVNDELHKLSPVYMWYDHKETFYVDRGSSSHAIRYMLSAYGEVPKGEQSVFTDFKSPERTAIQAGYFEKKNGRGYALMLLDIENPWGADNGFIMESIKNTPVTFKITEPDVRVSAYFKGEPVEITSDLFGNYSVVLKENAAVFITVDKN